MKPGVASDAIVSGDLNGRPFWVLRQTGGHAVLRIALDGGGIAGLAGDLAMFGAVTRCSGDGRLVFAIHGPTFLATLSELDPRTASLDVTRIESSELLLRHAQTITGTVLSCITELAFDREGAEAYARSACSLAGLLGDLIGVGWGEKPELGFLSGPRSSRQSPPSADSADEHRLAPEGPPSAQALLEPIAEPTQGNEIR